MKVSIYSLKKVLFEGGAESLNCKTASGEITILDRHRPLVSVLKSGSIKIIDKEKKERYIPIGGGFLEVNPGSRVQLIVEEWNVSPRRKWRGADDSGIIRTEKI